MDRADGDHPAEQRIDIAADDRLERHDDLRGDQHRIDPLMRRGAMGADAVDPDRDDIGARISDGFRHRDPAGRHVGRDVEGDGIVGLGKAGVEAVLDHRPGAGDRLLGGLGDEDQGARPVRPPRRHLPRRADQRGDVHVMAAGVHHRLLDAGAVGLPGARWIGDAGALLQRQAVHVGAQHHRRPGAVAQQGDDAVAADAGRHLVAERAQLARHPRRGLHLAAGQFGIAMEMIEQGREIGTIVARHRIAQRVVLGGGDPRHGEQHCAHRDQWFHSRFSPVRRGEHGAAASMRQFAHCPARG